MKRFDEKGYMVCFVVSLLKQKIKIVAFVHHGFGGRVELSRGSRVYFCWRYRYYSSSCVCAHWRTKIFFPIFPVFFLLFPKPRAPFSMIWRECVFFLMMSFTILNSDGVCLMCSPRHLIWLFTKQILNLLRRIKICFVNNHIKCRGLYIRWTQSDFSSEKEC